MEATIMGYPGLRVKGSGPEGPGVKMSASVEITAY